MNAQSALRQVLLGCLLAATLVGCGASGPEPTATLIPPTETPGPLMTKSCEDVDGPCVQLDYTGSRCVYHGPETFTSGNTTTLIFNNNSADRVMFSWYRLKEDRSIQDVIDGVDAGIRNFRSYSHSYRDYLVSGNLLRIVGLVPVSGGVYALICRIDNPQTAWYGGNFTVTE